MMYLKFEFDWLFCYDEEQPRVNVHTEVKYDQFHMAVVYTSWFTVPNTGLTAVHEYWSKKLLIHAEGTLSEDIIKLKPKFMEEFAKKGLKARVFTESKIKGVPNVYPCIH